MVPVCDLVGLCSLLSLHAAVILGALEEKWWSISCEPGWRGGPRGQVQGTVLGASCPIPEAWRAGGQ